MTNLTTVFTSNYKTDINLDGVVQALIDAPTYMFIADGLTDTNSPADANSSIACEYAVLSSIICGKKVLADDVVYMIARNTWTANTVYDMYDTSVPELNTKTIHVINSSRSVYKCLFNNDGKPSTIEPTSLDPLAVQLADGYIWQFMYRLTTDQLNNRSTTDLIPVYVDEDVTANAVPGSIEVVVVSAHGEDYSATTSGTVKEIISNTVIRIENDASAVSGIYIDSSIYIEDGPGVGAISKITGYTSNGSGRFITTAAPLIGVSINSEYQIAPTVAITGNGTGAVARSLVNDDNQIDSIEMINPGSGYTSANVAVIANTAYGRSATARAVISPVNGHGYDVKSELFSRTLQVTTTLFGDESETIPADITFAQYGLIKDVRTAENTEVVFTSNTFSNVVDLNTQQISGIFEVGDVITGSIGDKSATVLAATSNSVTAIYSKPSTFASLDNLTNQDGVIASITSIDSQPNIYLGKASILSYTNINTVTRSANTQETVNILLRA